MILKDTPLATAMYGISDDIASLVKDQTHGIRATPTHKRMIAAVAERIVTDMIHVYARAAADPGDLAAIVGEGQTKRSGMRAALHLTLIAANMEPGAAVNVAYGVADQAAAIARVIWDLHTPGQRNPDIQYWIDVASRVDVA